MQKAAATIMVKRFWIQLWFLTHKYEQRYTANVIASITKAKDFLQYHREILNKKVDTPSVVKGTLSETQNMLNTSPHLILASVSS